MSHGPRDQRRSGALGPQGNRSGPSRAPSWDDKTVWTGSTLRDNEGRWHYFYTGTSQAEDGKIQRIGHAIGDDLETWERVGDGLCLDLVGPVSDAYETAWEGRWHDRAMRDPWVMKDPGGDGWLMYFTARVPIAMMSTMRGASGWRRRPI